MFGLFNLVRPVFNTAKMAPMAAQQPSTIFTRGLLKTHKATAKRWRKTANGFKRGKAGKAHGCAGWSHQYLKGLSGKAHSTKSQTKKLRKLLPYH